MLREGCRECIYNPDWNRQGVAPAVHQKGATIEEALNDTGDGWPVGEIPLCSGPWDDIGYYCHKAVPRAHPVNHYSLHDVTLLLVYFYNWATMHKNK